MGGPISANCVCCCGRSGIGIILRIHTLICSSINDFGYLFWQNLHLNYLCSHTLGCVSNSANVCPYPQAWHGIVYVYIYYLIMYAGWGCYASIFAGRHPWSYEKFMFINCLHFGHYFVYSFGYLSILYCI